jgi:hypothetical protein
LLYRERTHDSLYGTGLKRQRHGVVTTCLPARESYYYYITKKKELVHLQRAAPFASETREQKDGRCECEVHADLPLASEQMIFRQRCPSD